MTLLDTSGVLAAIRTNDVNHRPARDALLAAPPPLIMSPFILAELDYMVMRDMGQAAALTLLEDVARGAYTLVTFSPQDVRSACDVVTRYSGLEIGLADASIVVLASRYQTRDVLTLDRRHFRALRTSSGEGFRLLPDDR